jgi:N-dimethylarginine dimethylaminohydrolase
MDAAEAEGIEIVRLPSLQGVIWDTPRMRGRRRCQGQGYKAADQQFTRDCVTVTPMRTVIAHNFNVRQASKRQWETVAMLDLIRRGYFSDYGLRPADLGSFLGLGGDEFLEGGDLEFFFAEQPGGGAAQWVAVLGHSARSSERGVERAKSFLEVDGFKVVEVTVQRKCRASEGKGTVKGMHWTTHACKLGAHIVALKPGHFSSSDRAALRAAGLDVRTLPGDDAEYWSANVKLAKSVRNGDAVVFSHSGHPRTNDFFSRKKLCGADLRVIEVDFTAHLFGAGGGFDCTVNDLTAA